MNNQNEYINYMYSDFLKEKDKMRRSEATEDTKKGGNIYIRNRTNV